MVVLGKKDLALTVLIKPSNEMEEEERGCLLGPALELIAFKWRYTRLEKEEASVLVS